MARMFRFETLARYLHQAQYDVSNARLVASIDCLFEGVPFRSLRNLGLKFYEMVHLPQQSAQIRGLLYALELYYPYNIIVRQLA